MAIVPQSSPCSITVWKAQAEFRSAAFFFVIQAGNITFAILVLSVLPIAKENERYHLGSEGQHGIKSIPSLVLLQLKSNAPSVNIASRHSLIQRLEEPTKVKDCLTYQATRSD